MPEAQYCEYVVALCKLMAKPKQTKKKKKQKKERESRKTFYDSPGDTVITFQVQVETMVVK